MTKYIVIQHPRSGERYAAEVDTMTVLRAAGPLHHGEPTDPASLRDYLDNQMDGPARDDAAWLNAELDLPQEATNAV